MTEPVQRKLWSTAEVADSIRGPWAVFKSKIVLEEQQLQPVKGFGVGSGKFDQRFMIGK